MGNLLKTNKDFYWTPSDEPHAIRRKLILAKYPQIKKLMGHDSREALQCLVMVLVQIAISYYVREFSWPILILCAYVIGGTINHSLSLGMHEIAHNLAFGMSRPGANRILGMITNLPLGVPASITFKKYHLEHHKYQGDEIIDADLPTEIEVKLFSSRIGKFFFVLLQPLFYGLRPVIVLPKNVTLLELVNLTVQITFDFLIYYYFGHKSLSYLLLGTLLGLGLHPIAGHFIAEHYVFLKGYETYSYYGPLNFITFNVGYHNEHHDFPNIPGFRLPEVKRMAPEFYDNIPHHTSWVKVLYDFITMEEVGPFARIKRKSKYTREFALSNDKQHFDQKNFKSQNGNLNLHEE